MQHLPPTRETLESGDVALGARVGTFAPEMIELYGDLGLDFAWLDFEHGGPSADDVQGMAAFVRAAATAEIDVLARLPSGDPPLVRRVLDAGVRTLLIPRVETVADVRPAVEAARFAFDGGVGDRGIGGERASEWGAFPDGYVDREDDAVLVGAMVENAAAVENLPEILSIPHLGFVFVGPADLSVSLGHPLETDHPEVRETIEEVRTTSLETDVPIGRIADDAADAATAVENGYSLLRIGGDVASARRVLGERLRRFAAERGD
jgi:2-dehydro-3-deoxyglucarate aldolase